MPEGDDKPLSAAEFATALQKLKDEILIQAKEIATAEATKVADLKPPQTRADWAWRMMNLFLRFFSTGFFFIVLGAIILVIAKTTMGPTHTAFTFVLVVLGIAILLYGTGTQGMGSLESTSAASKYRVAIAGGAGVLAFCVALGIINYSEQMKGAFQVQKKYVRVQFGPGPNAPNLSEFLALFTIDGISVHSFRQGNAFEILVPYLGTDLALDKRLDKEDILNRPAGSDPQDCGATASATGNDQTSSSIIRQNLMQSRGTNKSLIKTVAVDFFPIGSRRTDPAFERIPTRYFYVRINDANFQGKDGAYDFERYSELMCVRFASKEDEDAQRGNIGARREETAPGSEAPTLALPPVITVPQ